MALDSRAADVTLTESIPRQRRGKAPRKARYLYGDEPAGITGIQGVGETLFVAIGKRGILSAKLPKYLTRVNSGAKNPLGFRRHRFKGRSVVDLTRFGGELFALMRKVTPKPQHDEVWGEPKKRRKTKTKRSVDMEVSGAMQLVHLQWNAKRKRLTLGASVTLPKGKHWFVHAFEPR